MCDHFQGSAQIGPLSIDKKHKHDQPSIDKVMTVLRDLTDVEISFVACKIKISQKKCFKKTVLAGFHVRCFYNSSKGNLFSLSPSM